MNRALVAAVVMVLHISIVSAGESQNVTVAEPTVTDQKKELKTIDLRVAEKTFRDSHTCLKAAPHIRDDSEQNSKNADKYQNCMRERGYTNESFAQQMSVLLRAGFAYRDCKKVMRTQQLMEAENPDLEQTDPDYMMDLCIRTKGYDPDNMFAYILQDIRLRLEFQNQ